MPILLTILIILGGGTSFAAQNALPGDALYPVKIHINEEVRGWVALSDEAKANWNAQIATTRLEEAEKLAAESKLDAQTKAELEASFQEHADKVEARIKEFEADHPDIAAKVVSNFETSLNAHERILSNIESSQNGAVGIQIHALLSVINKEQNDSQEIKIQNQAKVSASTNADVQPAAEGVMKAAQNKIDEVLNFINKMKDRLGAEATAQAEARLKLAQDTFVQAKAKFEVKLYGESFILFQKAHAIAQEAKLLIKAKTDFESNSEVKVGGSEIENNNSDKSEINVGNSNQSSTGSIQSNSKIKIDLGL